MHLIKNFPKAEVQFLIYQYLIYINLTLSQLNRFFENDDVLAPVSS